MVKVPSLPGPVVEQRGKDGIGVEARQTGPDQARLAVEQPGPGAVPDDGEVEAHSVVLAAGRSAIQRSSVSTASTSGRRRAALVGRSGWPDAEREGQALERAERVLVGLVVAGVHHAELLRPFGAVARAQHVEHGAPLVPPGRGTRLDGAERLARLEAGGRHDLASPLGDAAVRVRRGFPVVERERGALLLQPDAALGDLAERARQLARALGEVGQVGMHEGLEARALDLEPVVRGVGEARKREAAAQVRERRGRSRR